MAQSVNKELARRYFDERWNRINYEIVDELLVAGPGVDAQKSWMRSMHAAFSGMDLTVVDLVAEEDQVVVHWMLKANQSGDFVGVHGFGKPITRRGLSLLRIKDGKIVDDVAYADDMRTLLTEP
jgi:predicted ester cyclase